MVRFFRKRKNWKIKLGKFEIYFSAFIKLAGRGRPLRLIFDGGLRPEGLGIPVEPIVTFVRFVGTFTALAVDCTIVLGGLRAWDCLVRLCDEDAEDILCRKWIKMVKRKQPFKTIMITMYFKTYICGGMSFNVGL